MLQKILALLAAPREIQTELHELWDARRALRSCGWNTGPSLADGITDLATAWAEAERRYARTTSTS